MRTLVIFACAVLAVTAMPADLPEPGELALMLNEEDFEDYLDEWLAKEEPNWVNLTLADEQRNGRSGCTFRVNGDLGQPQPVYIRRNQLLMPSGNTGQIFVNTGEQIRIACTGSGRTIQHPNINANVAVATATCVSGNTVSGSGWLRANGAFGGLTCSAHAFHEAQNTNDRCFNNHAVIRVGFIVDNVFHTWYRSCFDPVRLEVLYVWYDQTAAYAVHQTGVDRPSWLAGSFFPGIGINNLYTQVQQKARIATIVGQALADRYVTATQFLARGHLAAKSDFPVATAQRATFYFINAAPQWQPFNAGNWNSLEQNLRARIGQANYNTVIYTGTFGVSQLRDASNRLQDIFLHQTGNTRQLPVPLYYYKVAYDAGRRLGTAFISINNPYYTAAEVRSLQFCTDRCRNNNAFSWLRWQPDRIDIGYSFCCTIADFRRVITHIPNWTVVGLNGVATMRSLVILACFVLAAAAKPAELPAPGELALMLSEEDFEDYLDEWLAKEEPKWINVSLAENLRNARSGCTFRVNGDLGQPQPVYIYRNEFLMPTGNTGEIHVNTGDEIRIACTGSGRTIVHPQLSTTVSTATATCVSDNIIFGSGWLGANGAFGDLICSSNAYHEAQYTGETCFNNNLVIRVGFIVDNVFHTWYRSCFDPVRLEVLYVWYEQTAAYAVHQTGVARPSWLVGGFFPGVGINNLYTQVQQKAQIASIVGDTLADQYVTATQFLARGHLAAKSDFPLATGQRASFYFINAAPQWQPFNAGNWNFLEQDLRARIGQANYNAMIYTGTFGVSQLRDANNVLQDIYLRDVGVSPQLPVPLYFYKVAYDAGRRLGTVFISINNPYYTAAEVRSLQFCTDRCRNNNAFSWLRWQPDRIDIGYSFCCTVADFRRVIPHIPDFEVIGLLSCGNNSSQYIVTMRSLVILACFVLAAVAMPAELPPGELALMLNEEDFEDYLDEWLAKEEPNWINVTLADEQRNARSGCTFRVNGDLGQPQPVYIYRDQLLLPTGNSGQMLVNTGEQIRIACTGSGRTIQHPNINANVAVATATCVSDNIVSGSGWLSANGAFGGLTCSAHAFHEAEYTGETCFNNNLVIRVGFIVDNVFHTWYRSCFDPVRLEVLYVWYDQTAAYAIHQTGVDRPSWLAGSFFPGVGINNLYTQVQQKAQIASIVGDTLADQYVTATQFLACGHLAAKSDFPLATGQRATFYFINAAPQWQPFNAGNWNFLEQDLRARIGQANYNTIIYTGTFGVSQLRDANNVLQDIYLRDNGGSRQLPVPLYYYKVAYDAGRRLGTAFISINNPYYTAAEVRSLQFCTDRCRNNNAFSWLSWQPDRIDIGYSFCCTIADFRRVITHIPDFDVIGLLS
ncbi:uncharacterized protein LOC135073485 [Ostrinia nubilalis]|uniref:uncharacterized protein LOC135073485 n=1 Tax=Ostrinia nubilalis TaxID=29057 RepID=UPI0030824338